MTRETVKFWQVPEADDLELLRATYIRHSFARHTHDTFAVGVIQQGTEVFAYRGATHRAPTGSVVLINPGEPHTGHAADASGWTYRMLYPAVSLLQRSIAETVAGAIYFPEPVVHDPSLRGWMLRSHQALEQNVPRLEQDSRLLWTFAQLVARHADQQPRWRSPGRETRAIAQAREYLEAHYSENVSLDELAAIAHLSPFYFLRVFRQQVGLPPHGYLNQVRLRQAKRLLGQGRAIATVAHLTGFADQSHLTRQFKRTWGVTPGQYQQRNFVQD
ncbi:AraC family transcriptional regulator [Nodosilinea sp. LEGE 06152]|uniref:AraC family transcriptional regulator n=1 Tax=Nodosilinea sp. LEGE 06152 TaxID=2777966 RepID=UPI00188209F9|nr:AraC family transcriptional regulator [Nodosilinea sp. LEGE 06152]MBE9155910.1 AraC family transcriptional regulator [Nodosilinea sp. LEGE 06152]